MGAWLSTLVSASKSPSNYEQILSELEDKIYRNEIIISEAHMRQRKVIGLLTTYSFIVYLFWLMSFFFVVWPKTSLADGISVVTLRLMPIFLIPMSIYSIRWIVQTYYKRYVVNQEQHLDSLRKKQKQKVEEMKQKVNYYTAKTLIERFEGPSGKFVDKSLLPSARQKFANDIPQPPSAHPADVNNNFSQQNLHGSPSRSIQDIERPPLSLLDPKQLVSPSFDRSPVVSIQPHHDGEAILNAPTVNPNLSHHAGTRTWMDRVLDLIIGEDSPGTRYALICEKCFNHNGLALEDELDSLRYICPKCSHLNIKRRKVESQSFLVGSQTPLPDGDEKSNIVSNSPISSQDQGKLHSD